MQTILFDLDGTLIDHFATIARSVNHAERRLGLPESTYETVRCMVGGGIHLTLERLMGAKNGRAAYPIFHDHFDRYLLDGAVALPHATWLLGELKTRGKMLGVLTNKSGRHSRALTRHFGMDRFLSGNVGMEDTPFRKPQPEFTRHILNLLGATTDGTVLIGDSPFDFAAAEAVGIPCHLVATGSHDMVRLRAETKAASYHETLHSLAEEVFELSPETSRK